MTPGTTGRVIVGLLWLTILIVVAAAWSAGAARGRVNGSAPPNLQNGAFLAPGDEAPPEFRVSGCPDVSDPLGRWRHETSCSDGSAATAATPRFDLYGNEIVDGVADYRIDVRGDVYERHSPDLEVTHLAPPSM